MKSTNILIKRRKNIIISNVIFFSLLIISIVISVFNLLAVIPLVIFAMIVANNNEKLDYVNKKLEFITINTNERHKV